MADKTLLIISLDEDPEFIYSINKFWLDKVGFEPMANGVYSALIEDYEDMAFIEHLRTLKWHSPKVAELITKREQDNQLSIEHPVSSLPDARIDCHFCNKQVR